MGTNREGRRVDHDGRVRIPKSIRDQLNLETGSRVEVFLDEDRIIISPRISRAEFIETMEGRINEETRSRSAESIQPEDLEADWASDLPSED